MFTKLLVIHVVVAILSIATESFADTVEIIEIDPQQFNRPNPNGGQCQHLMRFYSDYYKNAYSKLYKETYSKYYDEYYYNLYKQQSVNQRQGPDVNVDLSQVEWVCTNPKTKDKIIIGSEETPMNHKGKHFHPSPYYPPYNGGHFHPQGPYYPPPDRNPPVYQPPDFHPNHPVYRPSHNSNQNHPENAQQNPNGSSNQQYHKPEEPKIEEPNTNGEGVIDIRFGEE